MSSDESELRLGREWATAITKGTLGAVPVLGPLLAEIVGQLIPEARMKRLVGFAEELNRRLSGLEQAELGQRLMHSSVVALMEDALIQAARAASKTRQKQLAALVSRPILNDSSDVVKERHLLWLQSELSDTEILTLMSFHAGLRLHHGGFQDQRELIDGPFGEARDTPEGRQRAMIASSQKNHLLKLRLLYSEYMMPKAGELPHFDSATGKLVGKRYLITSLGELLLDYLGLLESLTNEAKRSH